MELTSLYHRSNSIRDSKVIEWQGQIIVEAKANRTPGTEMKLEPLLEQDGAHYYKTKTEVENIKRRILS